MRRRLRSHLGLAFLGGAAICAAVGGGLALAGPNKTVDSTVIVPGDRPNQTSANCPRFKQLRAAGFETTTDPGIGVVVSKLIPRKRGLDAAASNLGNVDGSLTAHAYCRQRPRSRIRRRAKLVRKAVPVAAHANASVVARCPAGKPVRLGGFKSTVDPDTVTTEREVVVSSMERISRRRWKVTGFNDGDDAGTLVAVALCGKRPKLKTVTATTEEMPPGETTATATCPLGKKLLFGGFRDNGVAGDAHFIRLLERVSPRAWTASTFAFAPNSSVTAIAYCTG